MKREFLILCGAGILNLLLFFGVFKLLQNDKIYHGTLGLISENYERIGGWNNFEIKKKSIPYLNITNEKFLSWDAGMYNCIAERMYAPEVDCYGGVRAAFFPLFPILWKTTGSTPLGISILNYLLFMTSAALLITLLLKTSISNKLILYSILITLPSTIVYYIPYTEALFMFTFSIAVIGILKKNYWIYFVGSFLLAMVRPATVFVLFAIILVQMIIYLSNKDFKLFCKELILKSIPFILGYFCAIAIQYLSSGSWTAMIDAHKNWSGAIQPIMEITDWSNEGFALSLFAIFFVCLPLMFYAIYLFIQWLTKKPSRFISKLSDYNLEYLMSVATFYLLGIFAFTLLTSGGNTHSFFRFTLASPLFYILVIGLMNLIHNSSAKTLLLQFLMSSICLFIFLHFVDYGGDRLNFSFFGLYMFVATALFLITKKFIVQPIKISIVLLLILFNTLWNTYLLNAFFSNGWIFT